MEKQANDTVFFESMAVEKALGWRIFQIKDSEIANVVAENEKRNIVNLRNANQVYVLKRLPVLGAEEAELLKHALHKYRTVYSREKIEPREAFEFYVRENSLTLDGEQKEYLASLLSRIVLPEGIISELLEHENIEEIAVIGLGKAKPVHVYDYGFGWIPTNLYFSKAEEVKAFVNSAGEKIGRRVTIRTPSLNAFLEDGSRLNAVMEPASVSGPLVTIRKFRKKPFTPTELFLNNTASLEQLAFLWMAMQADCSVLVCGNTGSGKTTLLNSLFTFVPKTERIIVVEETPEIIVPHRHWLRMSTSDAMGISMHELVVNTLRMRPDRVIVGEVRKEEEVKAFMDTLLAGQGKGHYATFHAQSSREAISRLKNLGAMEQDMNAIDLILVQKRWSRFNGGKWGEERKLAEIAEPRTVNNKLSAAELSKYDFGKNKFGFNSVGEKASEKICTTFGLKKNRLKKELLERKEHLKKLAGKGMEEFFDAVNEYGKTP